jgi:multidrug efflux pump subunit AcrA (membrane-fusion protein)
MRRRWLLAGAAVPAAAAVAVGAVGISGPHPATAADTPVSTADVIEGRLSATVSRYGTLTYRARPDGSPYAVFERADGTYTELPQEGDEVDCGDVLYRVDELPVLLLCGSTPAYRTLSAGDAGRDVVELNANLVRLGYATRAQLDPSSDTFGSGTASALEKLQSELGEERTGSLELGRAAFLPGPVRVAEVTAELGGSARPGEPVLYATSGTPEVQVALDPSQQSEVKAGEPVQITLPGGRSATGKVERLGRVARVPTEGNAAATIPAYVALDDPEQASGLDRAPVQVEIATRSVESALSVPVTAIVGRSGGGFAVEVMRDGGRREPVAVKLGLFDGAGGRVQVEGELRPGDRVVVPSP